MYKIIRSIYYGLRARNRIVRRLAPISLNRMSTGTSILFVRGIATTRKLSHDLCKKFILRPPARETRRRRLRRPCNKNANSQSFLSDGRARLSAMFNVYASLPLRLGRYSALLFVLLCEDRPEEIDSKLFDDWTRREIIRFMTRNRPIIRYQCSKCYINTNIKKN